MHRVWFSLEKVTNVVILSSSSSFSFGIEMVSSELLLAHHGRWTSTLSEGHSHQSQKSLPFFICTGRRWNAHIHSPGFTERVESDLREHALVTNSNGVIAISVEAALVHTLEIPRPRKPQVNKAIKERVHHLQNNKEKKQLEYSAQNWFTRLRENKIVPFWKRMVQSKRSSS